VSLAVIERIDRGWRKLRSAVWF